MSEEQNLNNDAVEASELNGLLDCPELVKASLKLSERIRELIMGGYDGPCMGDEFAFVMDAIIEYDDIRARHKAAVGS